jgi:hypothetical protein
MIVATLGHHYLSRSLKTTIYRSLKVDGDQTNPPAPYKQHNISSIPVDAVFEGGAVDEYATHEYTNSTKTGYIDPREWIDLLPRAFSDILPPVYAYIPGFWTPRQDKTVRQTYS